eukprot:gnl/MRDRNA2_/MRDRNA2_95938_c0_seq1.p1 gnl/MRDRNA2_/MRDRNA2_95938_c0~~gnl/MRDRNA2_/MRDRNA2_95938_c0_seq1.p1  ORF type:complete len:206 (+),score=27.31 gnl/MRDRNA2_/MRDRNA2_95938_c0_seq1:85-702(+)
MPMPMPMPMPMTYQPVILVPVPVIPYVQNPHKDGRQVSDLPKVPKVDKPSNVKADPVKELAFQPWKPAKKKNLKKKCSEFPAEITTMMIRGVPCSFTQEALLSLIDDAGLKNKYDFFYLPRGLNRSGNLGYAFINFLDQHHAELFKATFEGVPLAPATSMKTCSVLAGDIQGLPALRKHFRHAAVSRGDRKPMFRRFEGGKVIVE